MSSISRIRNGKQSVNEQYLVTLAKELGISAEQFLDPARTFAEAIGLSPAEITSILAKYREKTSRHSTINDTDLGLLDSLEGSYILLYLCREVHNINVRYLGVEKLLIEARLPQEEYCGVSQIENLMTGDFPSGRVYCKSDRLVANLTYQRAYFSDSVFYLQPVIVQDKHNLLNGIYVDVTATVRKEIFATRCVLVQVESLDVFERKYFEESRMFEVWEHLLSNELEGRHRLVAPSGEDYEGEIRGAASWTREEKGG